MLIARDKRRERLANMREEVTRLIPQRLERGFIVNCEYGMSNVAKWRISRYTPESARGMRGGAESPTPSQ